MTPIRQKESLHAELAGLEHLFSLTPDGIAKSLLKSRLNELKDDLKKLDENLPLTPETEIFFADGPVIGSSGIDAVFAGNVLTNFQSLVRKQFAAKFCGVLLIKGRITGESISRLFLTALPTGSFGLQLSQPNFEDWITAGQLTETMEDVAELVGASAKDDKTFVEAIANFNGRVKDALVEFLKVLNNAGSDCRIVSGRRQVVLKKEQVAEAYQRAISAETNIETIYPIGIFRGAIIGGIFNFLTQENSLISGRLGEEVTDEQAIEWDNKFAGLKCQAEIRLTTISIRTGQKSSANELLNLKPIFQIPPSTILLPPPT